MIIITSENSSIRCIKLSLIFFTVILVITGISLIIIGSTINAIFVEFEYFLVNIYFSPATFIVTIGFIIFGIACFGCYGAIRESVCVITAFGILLGITALMQGASGILSNFLMLEINSETHNSINSTMIKYSSDNDAQNAIDYLQQELQCCGLTGPKDWTLSLYGDGYVPMSCCASYSPNKKCENTFNIGCQIILNTILVDSSKILTVSAYLLTFTQIFGMLFSFYLSRILREQKLARDYRRWAIRNQLLSNMVYDPNLNSSNPFYDNVEKNKEVSA